MSEETYGGEGPHLITVPLKPCPFCGESLIEQNDHHGTWMAHYNPMGNCECALTQLFDNEDARRWNTRTNPKRRTV